MSVFYLIIVLLTIIGLKFTPPNISSSVSRDCTNSIKGLFILVVFSRHIWPYMGEMISELSFLDRVFITIDTMIRQLLVAMFLFYSGYGVTKSIADKGNAYLHAIPSRRIFITIVNFAVAVGIFILLDFTLGIPVTTRQALLSFIVWDSVGNSNWYIFCIVCCYAFTYLSFRIARTPLSALIALGIMCTGYIVVISQYKGSWWYDTIGCYWAGSCFALCLPRIKDTLERNYYWILLSAALLFIVFYNCPWKYNGYVSNITAILFSAIILMLTMCIKINNAPLRWLGRNLFPLYIYQRIPMLLFATIGEGWLIAHHAWLYVTLSLAITIGITLFYPRITVTTNTLRQFRLSKA